MHKWLLLYILFSMGWPAGAQAYKPVHEKSAISFSIKNFGSAVTGHFSDLEGSLLFDASDPAKSSFKVSLDASSVNTGNRTRDNHLRKEEFFDVAKYPRIRFVSSRITGSKTAGYIVYGTLTIKATSKEISFPFKATPKDGGILFEGGFSLNRRDYRIGKNSLVMGDNVTMTILVFGMRK